MWLHVLIQQIVAPNKDPLKITIEPINDIYLEIIKDTGSDIYHMILMPMNTSFQSSVI